MNKRLKAELWEIQAILYLILAQFVETDWIMWLIRAWAFFTIYMATHMLAQASKEDKEAKLSSLVEGKK